MLRHRAQPEMQVDGQGAEQLEALVQAPYVEDMIVKPPGNAVALVGAIQKRLVELRIPAADDGLVLAPLVELPQHFFKRRRRSNAGWRNLVDLGRLGALFHLAWIGQRVEIVGFALTVGLENAADFDDAVPVDIETGRFQINED